MKGQSVLGLAQMGVREVTGWYQNGRADSPLAAGLVAVALATVVVAIVVVIIEMEATCWVVVCAGADTEACVPLT